MIYDPVQAFLEEVTAAYRRSPGEIALVVALVFLLLAVIISYGVWERRRIFGRIESESRELFLRRTSRMGLSPSQMDVLNTMASSMPSPREPHRLLEDEAIFDRHLRRAFGSNRPPDDTIAGLRLALGYKERGKARALRSTAHLTVGARAWIRRGTERPRPCRVDRVARAGVVLRLAGDGALPSPPCDVEVFLAQERGIVTFRSMVLKASGTRILVKHRENVQLSQRRGHYRARASVPITLTLFDEDGEETSLKGRTLDVGGGGAAARLPGGRDLQAGVGGIFTLGMDPPVRGGATVVRVGRDKEGMTVHLRFTRLAESDRDRIYRELFRRPATEPSPEAGRQPRR